MEYIIKLAPGLWVADWEGDPGRTLREHNAKRFRSVKKAEKALKKAKRFRIFPKAEIVEL